MMSEREIRMNYDGGPVVQCKCGKWDWMEDIDEFGMCRKCQQQEIERLRSQLCRVAEWAYCQSKSGMGWKPFFEAGSHVDQILMRYVNDEMRS